ncbi:Peptide-N4-(N-acetyl-beta-glucosaminyl)asparagineamidase A [Linum grandiflorum]
MNPKLKRTTTTTSTPNSKHLHSPKPNVLLFQVTKPIDVPNTVPCKQLLFQHQFGSTEGEPSVIVNYTGPPPHCASNDFSKIVLEWSGTCNGSQDDSVFGVWLGGVEILRSSPAQPQRHKPSLAWKAQKDITRYSSLLLKKDTQKLAVFFRNKLDDSYSRGVYHVSITISFYPSTKHNSNKNLGMGSESGADLILPISQNLQTKGGLWYQIKNSTDGKRIKFKIPQNTYRAVLEVYVSSHNTDEYWYSNYLPEFYNSNQFEDVYANGPFRDVTVGLDGVQVGAIWPYHVINRAGSDMWNPVVSIHSFDLPSYDVELTPFLGNLLDDMAHNLSFGVGNAIDVWYVDANLHLWLDHKIKKTEAKLVGNHSKPLHLSSKMTMLGVNGESSIHAERMISSQGWVKSSYGNITVQVTQNLSYTNYLDIEFDSHNAGNRAAGDRVEQLILWNDSVSFVKDDYYSTVMLSMKKFSLAEVHEQVLMEGEGNAVDKSNITLGYSDLKIKHDKSLGSEDLWKKSILNDEQSGSSVWVVKNFTWFSALQDMNQSYTYVVDGGGKNLGGSNKGGCYFRNIRSFNATVVHDHQGTNCV